MSVQGVPGQGQGYDPYMDYLNSLQYLQQGSAQRGPGLGQTSGANNSILNFPPIAGVAPAQAAPPKKAGFFGKLKAVVKGVAKIPENIVKGAVDIVKDPKKLILTAGILALSLNPVTGPIVAPLAIGTALFSAGSAVVKGGMTTYQGWKAGDLQAIEQGVTTAGTGVAIAAITRRGAKSYLGSKGEVIKGTGFKQLNTQSWNAAKGLKTQVTNNGGGLVGAQAVGRNAYQAQVNQVQGLVNTVKPKIAQVKDYRLASNEQLTSRLNSIESSVSRPTASVQSEFYSIQQELARRGTTLTGPSGQAVIETAGSKFSVPSFTRNNNITTESVRQAGSNGFAQLEGQTARAGQALGEFNTLNPGILPGVVAPRFNRDALQDYNPFLNQQQALGAGF